MLRCRLLRLLILGRRLFLRGITATVTQGKLRHGVNVLFFNR